MFDVLVAVAWMVVLVPDLVDGDGPRRLGLSVGWWVAGGVVLVFRRRWPVPVMALLVALLLVTSAIGLDLPVFFLVLVALYTVIVDAGTRTTAITATATVLIVDAVHARPWAGGDEFDRFLLAGGVVVAVTGIALYRAARLAAVDQLRERAELLAQRAALLEREQEQQRQLAISQERVRIAAEMHDVVGHHLTVMVTLAEGTLRALPVDGPTAEPIRLVAETGREALTETRRILGVLRVDSVRCDRRPSDKRPTGMAERLEALLAPVEAAGVTVGLVGQQEWSALPERLREEMLRVVQEALTNVLKHAGPGSAATVTLERKDFGLRLIVSDDGAGTPASPAMSSGAGLTGISQRLAPWAGQVAAAPRPQGGWLLSIGISAGAIDSGVPSESVIAREVG